MQDSRLELSSQRERDSHLIQVSRPASDQKNWYAVYTMPRHEKSLAQQLSVKGIEHYLPLYRTVKRWKDGSRVTLELPLFASYIFVRICRKERTSVLGSSGALSIVGTAREPAPLQDSEVEALRRGVALERVEPHRYLVLGQRVRIVDGPFSGMEGVLVRKKNFFRVVLTLSIIMESIAVELDACDVCSLSPESIAAGRSLPASIPSRAA